MKIQYLAVIFLVIIIPITIVTSSYINSQIKTIDLQINYDTKLTDSTYDAIKAFQINTVNNRFSSVSDSKIRDIEAAINTFYNSFSNNEQLTKEELQSYVPALVFTLYDGYYIYNKYDNAILNGSEENKGRPITDIGTLTEEQSENQVNYGLKPYIYYSCRYKNGSKEFVVNYTLDNAITLYGKFDGINYQTLSGYLINPDDVNIINANPDSSGKLRNLKLTYSNVTITPEVLTEHLLFDDKDSTTGQYIDGDYEYLAYNDQKIYYDKNYVSPADSLNSNYFYYQNYGKSYITKSPSNDKILAYLNARTWDGNLHSTSSFDYYNKAKEFSIKVADLTRDISQKHAIDENGNAIKFPVDTGDSKIFVASNTNNPLLTGSCFDENRREVIRKSIETNLSAAIANYNIYSSENYEFSLPVLKEEDWEKITNNVSVLSFLQGIPIGHKYYNNYCVITNDSNEEVIKKENIYIITEKKTNTADGKVNVMREYHLPGCPHLIEGSEYDQIDINSAYSSIDFLMQTVRIAEGNYIYFYPQTRKEQANTIGSKYLTACYYCMVNAAAVYSPDEIIQGRIFNYKDTWNEQEQEWQSTVRWKADSSSGKTEEKKFAKVREYYIKALARERYDLYQANIDAFDSE